MTPSKTLQLAWHSAFHSALGTVWRWNQDASVTVGGLCLAAQPLDVGQTRFG